VLLVPAPAGKVAGAVDLSAAPSLQNILAPLDGSLEAEAALPIACRFAEAFEGSLTLVNVQDPARTSGSFDHTTPTGYLRGQVAELSRREVAAKAYVVTTSGDAGSAVARFADQRQADLLALAGPPAGVWSRLFGRGLAASLLRRLPRPLLPAAANTEVERPAVTTVVE